MDKDKRLLLSACPICESDRFYYSFVSRGNAVCRCNECRHMFLNPQPAYDVLTQIYSSNYFLEDDDRVLSSIKSETAGIYLQQLIDYLGRAEGSLLEIGCGNGDFLVAAQKCGFTIAGVEMSPFATDQANEKLGGELVKCGILETSEFPAGYFDVCVLFDALEHTRQPIELLKIINRILKPDGVLFLVLPSLDSWSAKVMKSKWMEFKTEHLHYFDSQTIQNALTRSGFGQVSVRPNYKVLTFDYIHKHFTRYKVPLFTKSISLVNSLAPSSLRKKQFKVLASGMSVLCRSIPLREKPLVSVVVPVYNERDTFPVLMESLLSKEIKGAAKEIIIIESNSVDGTRDEVLRFKDSPGVRIILENEPKGKGHAVRTGLNYISGDFVMIQDGDLEYDINDYDQLLEPLIKYQQAFVLGSRHLGGWKMRQFTGQVFLSAVMNFGQVFFTSLLNLFCGQRLKDPFTMYKVFRRDCLYGLDFKANRFDFDWEIVIKLLRKGYRPLEIPVNYRSRSFKEGKKVSMIKDPLSWLWALIRFRFSPLYQSHSNSDHFRITAPEGQAMASVNQSVSPEYISEKG